MFVVLHCMLRTHCVARLHAKDPHKAQRAHVRKTRLFTAQRRTWAQTKHICSGSNQCMFGTAMLASQQQLHVPACVHTSQRLTSAKTAAEALSIVSALAAAGRCALGGHARQRVHEHAAPDARHQRVLLTRAHALCAAHLRGRKPLTSCACALLAGSERPRSCRT